MAMSIDDENAIRKKTSTASVEIHTMETPVDRNENDDYVVSYFL